MTLLEEIEEVNKKIRSLDKKKDKELNKIKELRKTCRHNTEKVPARSYFFKYPDFVKKEYRSDTGNYDPSCDSYWVNLHCTLCDERWKHDSE